MDEAGGPRPSDFANNGWVVAALQAAWSAIATTPVPVTTGVGVFRADHLRRALDAAVRAGNDTDTVAAIAGGLLGAAYGASAVPLQWRCLLHGWPGNDAHGLVGLAAAIERKGAPERFDFTYPGSPVDTLARHPHDDRSVVSAASARCDGCPPRWTRSSRCADWPMRDMRRRHARTSRCA